MHKKISLLQSYLQKNLSADVAHEALNSLHRFHIGQKHILYIGQDVLRDKQLDEILALLELHNIAGRFQTASAPTCIHLSDSDVYQMNLDSMNGL